MNIPCCQTKTFNSTFRNMSRDNFVCTVCWCVRFCLYFAYIKQQKPVESPHQDREANVYEWECFDCDSVCKNAVNVCVCIIDQRLSFLSCIETFTDRCEYFHISHHSSKCSEQTHPSLPTKTHTASGNMTSPSL